VYRQLQRRLVEHVREFLRTQYQIELANIVVEQPPKIEMGEYALPFSFELAKKLRKAPRKIAEEVVAAMPKLEGFGDWEVAGAGYINARVDRAAMAKQLAEGGEEEVAPEHPGKILVEHTSINPNKAAHIGHLRNSILGDTFVRLLRAAGREVDVQNYIDNTGVQVADVVVGFVELEKKSKADIEQLIASQKQFDYFCWDLYARVSQWYEEAGQQESRKKLRLETLHAIEQGGNERAEIANLISTAVLKRHLETMERLDIEYDFLPREWEILHLQFWAAAFEELKKKGVLYFETEGKNKGCWVMTRPGAKVAGDGAESGPDEDAKVIVRSNGTVGYVGKDIAYHMWKFGLLSKDFGYIRFYKYPSGNDVWISTDPKQGEAKHPHFGSVSEVYNVIDSRQSDPQDTVKQAIRLMGYTDQADHYTHFSYEMVALTPRCALDLGYEVSEEDRQKSYIEVSGRKGFGIKADDLIDRLIAEEKIRIREKNPAISDDELKSISTDVAIGALRYFMLKFTRSTVIAFDMADALNAEGETGVYLMYSVVRAGKIFSKGGVDPATVLAAGFDTKPFFEGEEGNEFWQLWLAASQTSTVMQQSIAQAEPAYLAKHAFQLAQQFNNFYHRHHILNEADASRQQFLYRTAAVVRRELVRILSVMGISAPESM
jgi:arginyl-tRNA synthetase